MHAPRVNDRSGLAGSFVHSGCGEVETGVHVEPEVPVGVDVSPEQQAERPAVLPGQDEAAVVQDPLQEDRVEVHQRGLQQVQAQHGDLLLVAVGAGQLALLAVEDVAVGIQPRRPRVVGLMRVGGPETDLQSLEVTD